MAEIIWAPHYGSQNLFLTCPVYECLIQGTRGGGKTDCLLMSFAKYVGRGYGAAWTGALFRQTYPQLADVLAKSKRWFYQIFPGAKFNESDYFWTFPGGERLYFRYGDKEDDYWNYHGHEYPFLAFEELTNWKDDKFYTAMLSTCRSSVDGIPRMVRATTNPFGKGHQWVKDRYEIGMHKPGYVIGNRKGRTQIFSSIFENEHLLKADPDYIQTLIDLKDPNRRKAWLYGDWDIHVGSFLEEVWDPKKCIVEPFTIPGSWEVWRSFDWGYSAPYACYWLAMDPDGVIYVWKELYGAGEIPGTGTKEDARVVARKIAEAEKHFERLGYDIRLPLADPSIFSKIGVEETVASIMREEGVRFYPAWNAKGSRVNGAQKIVQLLADGKLKFFKTCKHAIRTIPALHPSETVPDDVDTTEEDHAWDAIRYGVMRKRRSPDDIKETTTPDNDFERSRDGMTMRVSNV